MLFRSTYFEGLTIRNTEIAIWAGTQFIVGSRGLTVKHCRFENIASIECGDDAGNQTTSTDIDDDRLELWDVLEEFERQRPMPRDDERVAMRMDEDAPLLLDELECAIVRSRRVGRREIHGRAEHDPIAARELRDVVTVTTMSCASGASAVMPAKATRRAPASRKITARSPNTAATATRGRSTSTASSISPTAG